MNLYHCSFLPPLHLSIAKPTVHTLCIAYTIQISRVNRKLHHIWASEVSSDAYVTFLPLYWPALLPGVYWDTITGQLSISRIFLHDMSLYYDNNYRSLMYGRPTVGQTPDCSYPFLDFYLGSWVACLKIGWSNPWWNCYKKKIYFKFSFHLFS